MVLTTPKVPKNPYPAFSHYAKPILFLTVFLSHTMSSADYPCSEQNFKIRPFLHPIVSLLLNAQEYQIRCLLKSKG